MRVLKSSSVTLLLIPWVFINYVGAIRSDLYLNKDKFGEFLRLEISEKGCTNVPLNWDNQAISLDTHGSCVKFYDLPYCRGKYVAIQPYHGTFQDNLETLGFKQIISSASPCGPKVPTGRYYILNGADGSVLTIDKKNGSVVAKTLPFKPYILKNQQFQVDKIALADYEIIPRVHEDLNPITYNMHISTKSYPVKRSWKIESVYRGKYIIKNEWNSRCLYKSESGKVEEHECVAWSPNQEWMFKAIKVQPFFPSKEELTKKPIRPDENLPFQPQQDVFPHFHLPPRPQPRPGQPLRNPNKKKNKKKQPQDDNGRPTLPIINRPFERPNPIVLNPREPFPGVQPVPIYPQSALRLPPIGIGPDGKVDPKRQAIPHVVHPGRLPFPRDPVVSNPTKSVWPPTLFGQFGQWTTARPVPATVPKKKTSDEEDEEDEEKEEDEDKEKEDDDKEEKEDDDKEEVDEDDKVEAEDTQKEDDDQEEKEDDDKDENKEEEERDDDREEPEEGSIERDEKEDRTGPHESFEDDNSAESEESEERK
ncbi:hypothetical protein Ocin01_04196 [Orchesella cincta]|uniref:Uncharacterized protein n=1 Tax=Orchesella cincta TaxID=48709 RepID=A0A1D2NB67_ORCCI|nr:hypothetical protein Ocin01_04196 [Orchesella cincta]